MATLGNGMPTYVDLMKEIDPNGMMAEAVDIISQEHSVIMDAGVEMANNMTSNQTTVVKTKQTGSIRAYNAGVPIEKSTTEQADDPIAMIESWKTV